MSMNKHSSNATAQDREYDDRVHGDAAGSEGRHMDAMLPGKIQYNGTDNNVALPTHRGSEGDDQSPKVLTRVRVDAPAEGQRPPLGESYTSSFGGDADALTEPDEMIQFESNEERVMCPHGAEWVTLPQKPADIATCGCEIEGETKVGLCPMCYKWGCKLSNDGSLDCRYKSPSCERRLM